MFMTGPLSARGIGRFYNDRHHTTVLHTISKIEHLRQKDETIDALIKVLTAALSPTMEGQFTQRFERGWRMALNGQRRTLASPHQALEPVELN